MNQEFWNMVEFYLQKFICILDRKKCTLNSSYNLLTCNNYDKSSGIVKFDES